MAGITYRGNLLARVFPFLSNQFGQTVVVSQQDQAAAFQNNSGDSSGGDNNFPQAYYMHNVMPTGQGYKSVDFTSVVPPVGVAFSKVIPVRDPDMVRGWLGVTEQGKIYIYRAEDSNWTDISDQVNWAGGNLTEAYAAGYTYICLSGLGVFKISVYNKTITYVNLAGVVSASIVAITSNANYMILTDGVSIYWSSTITAEDFVPSQITGAGSGTPTDVKGRIVTLAPISGGFLVCTSVNIVIALYSQNPKFPWIFKAVTNSKGISSLNHIASADDSDSTYVWTAGGLQRISNVGAVTTMAEVTDFLAGKEYEDFNSEINTLYSEYLYRPLQVKLAFIGSRFLIVSYGVMSPTHALVYDTALRRWGKLRFQHVACFEVTLNTDGHVNNSTSASAKKTLGLVTAEGEVVICNFDNNAVAKDSLIILGKYQLLRSRLATLDKISLETVDSNSNMEVFVTSTLDGKTELPTKQLTYANIKPKYREYPVRVTGVNHSILIKGTFNLNSIEIEMHINGRR